MKYVIFSILLIAGSMFSASHFIFNSQEDMSSKQTVHSNQQDKNRLSIDTIKQNKTSDADVVSEDVLQKSVADDQKDTKEGYVVDISESKENMMKDTTQNTIVEGDIQGRTMLVAGGCFWCVESDLEKLPGVVGVVSGYAGGGTQNPTYKNYIQGGHREVVEVTYNPAVISFEEILIYTMKHTDPTDDDGSFADRGNYYSAAFYYDSDEQKEIIDALIKEVDESGPYDKPLAIDILKRPTFWPTEEYHQNYYKKGISSLKYKYYRNASGRDDFIEKYWGDATDTTLPWRKKTALNGSWNNFQKPNDIVLKQQLTDIQYKVTQKNGTERAFNNEYLDNHEEGIYVDIVSGEPLFSSTHKFDSGTGWPSFTRPIEYSMVKEKDDYVLLRKRTEIRSAIADSHLGHVFNDAPKELGGIRYCMNSASLRFVPKEKMKEEGYGEYLELFT